LTSFIGDRHSANRREPLRQDCGTTKGSACAVEIGGTYPMLYAFFDEAGRLRRDAVSRQIEALAAAPPQE
jgi:hypothetical protein